MAKRASTRGTVLIAGAANVAVFAVKLGSQVWDGAASITIGALLVAVAVRLGLDSRDYLIERAADPQDLKLIRDEISADRAEDVADEIDRRLVSRLPQVSHVFLDPTQTPVGSSARPGP